MRRGVLVRQRPRWSPSRLPITLLVATALCATPSPGAASAMDIIIGAQQAGAAGKAFIY